MIYGPVLGGEKIVGGTKLEIIGLQKKKKNIIYLYRGGWPWHHPCMGLVSVLKCVHLCDACGVHAHVILMSYCLFFTFNYGWLYAGHFLPEEDDKFLERVRAAVEEEERQAMAAAETDAAKGAIATAEESRKTIQSGGLHTKDASDAKDGMKESNDEINESTDNLGSGAVPGPSGEKGSKGQVYGGAYDSVANLPIEFYHYYHGSNNDMGTLIEVIFSNLN